MKLSNALRCSLDRAARLLLRTWEIVSFVGVSVPEEVLSSAKNSACWSRIKNQNGLLKVCDLKITAGVDATIKQ